MVRLDLRGVKGPLNWAHAKVRLERMAPGETLELTLDDPRGARDIPRAAEAEGEGAQQELEAVVRQFATDTARAGVLLDAFQTVEDDQVWASVS